MKSRAHIFISGLVQGVFFRSFVRSEARIREITGWVKNLSDGRVEAVLEGEREKIEELIKLCHQGPPGAHVEGVSVEWEKYSGRFKDFEIRY